MEKLQNGLVAEATGVVLVPLDALTWVLEHLRGDPNFITPPLLLAESRLRTAIGVDPVEEQERAFHEMMLAEIQRRHHLNVTEVMRDGTRIPYATTESGDIEISVGSPKKA